MCIDLRGRCIHICVVCQCECALGNRRVLWLAAGLQQLRSYLHNQPQQLLKLRGGQPIDVPRQPHATVADLATVAYAVSSAVASAVAYAVASAFRSHVLPCGVLGSELLGLMRYTLLWFRRVQRNGIRAHIHSRPYAAGVLWRPCMYFVDDVVRQYEPLHCQLPELYHSIVDQSFQLRIPTACPGHPGVLRERRVQLGDRREQQCAMPQADFHAVGPVAATDASLASAAPATASVETAASIESAVAANASVETAACIGAVTTASFQLSTAGIARTGRSTAATGFVGILTGRSVSRGTGRSRSGAASLAGTACLHG